MVKKIAGVNTSTSGRVYATDLAGNALFPRTKDMGATLKAGAYVNVIEQMQTQTRDASGNLVELETPVAVLIITAVFPDKNAAIEASAETEVFELESKAYARAQVSAIATQYKVNLADLATV